MNFRFLACAEAWVAIASAAVSVFMRVQEGPPWAVGNIVLNLGIIAACMRILILGR